jgi:hypothetical protein
MIYEYIYKLHLTSLQKKLINDFHKNSKIKYKKIVNCEICKSTNIKLLFKNDRYGINQKTSFCDECGFMFSNPRMTDQSAQFFYNSDFYRILYGTGISEETLYNKTLLELKNYKPSLPKKPNFNYYYDKLYFDFINNEITDFESVMDIGSGRGKKIIDFNYIGKKIQGIEPSKTYHRVHAEFGLNSKIGYLKDIKEKYDLVLLSHVFEHLNELTEVVEILSNITKKYLFIEVPGHVKKIQSIQIAHNYYFSLNTLNYFILNNKFKLIKINYDKQNEFIFALYEKIEEKSEYKFNKKLERKNIQILYWKYITKYILIKITRLIGLERITRIFYRKLKKLLNKLF